MGGATSKTVADSPTVNAWAAINQKNLSNLRNVVSSSNIDHRVLWEEAAWSSAEAAWSSAWSSAAAAAAYAAYMLMGNFTASHAAAYWKWAAGLEYLLSCQPDPELCTGKGYSLLEVANKWGNAEVQKLVREYVEGYGGGTQTTVQTTKKVKKHKEAKPAAVSSVTQHLSQVSVSDAPSSASKGGSDNVQLLRASDLSFVTSPSRPLPPFHGIRQQALRALEDAVAGYEKQMGLGAFVDQGLEWGRKLQKAKYKNKHNVAGLTADQAAAIYLYTTESLLYRTLNSAMRSEDREKAKPFFPYLRLLLSALDNIASCKATAKPGIIWRGVRLHPKQLQEQKTSVKEIIADLQEKKEDEERLVWWPPSSCTTDMDTSISFTGGKNCPDPRIIFAVHSKRGVPIVDYSAIPMEAEVLQPPGSAFLVKNVGSPADNLWIVQLEEVVLKRDLVS